MWAPEGVKLILFTAEVCLSKSHTREITSLFNLNKSILPDFVPIAMCLAFGEKRETVVFESKSGIAVHGVKSVSLEITNS